LQGNLICVVYEDDCLSFDETNKATKKAVQKLRDAELDLNVEEDVACSWDISMEDQPSGTVQLSQKVLNRISTILDLIPGGDTKKTPVILIRIQVHVALIQANRE